LVERLTARIAVQDERTAELGRQVGRNSCSSSQPPSADRPRGGRRRGRHGGAAAAGRSSSPARAGRRCCRPAIWTRSSITCRPRAAVAVRTWPTWSRPGGAPPGPRHPHDRCRSDRTPAPPPALRLRDHDDRGSPAGVGAAATARRPQRRPGSASAGYISTVSKHGDNILTPSATPSPATSRNHARPADLNGHHLHERSEVYSRLPARTT
jgi:hypothetical protein